MGRAAVGLADDSGAVFINPAGLSRLQNYDLSNMYSAPAPDNHLLFLGGALPLAGLGTVGIGYDAITILDVPYSTTESADYNQQVILLFYSRPILDNLALGGGLKLYSEGPSIDVAPGTAGSGMDLDLSLKYMPQNWLGVGANLQNLLPESMGGKITLKSGVTEGIPYNLKLGVSSKIWGETNALYPGNQDLYLNFDLDQAASVPTLFHLGTEWRPKEFIALRAGIDQNSALLTGQTFNNLTIGFGFKYAGISFDYAYYQKGDGSGQTENYFSLGYSGEQKAKVPPPPPAATQEAAIPRKHFTDVPAAYWANDPIEILAGMNIISGYPDGTFLPEKTITRAEMCALLVKAQTLPPPSSKKIQFKDLSDKNWAKDFIDGAVALGIVTGYPDHTFRPNQKISRLEGTIMAARFDGLSAEAVSEAPYSDLPGRNWAAPMIAAAKRAGLLSFIGNWFEPNKNLTRAETAEILFHTQIIGKKFSEGTKHF